MPGTRRAHGINMRDGSRNGEPHANWPIRAVSGEPKSMHALQDGGIAEPPFDSPAIARSPKGFRHSAARCGPRWCEPVATPPRPPSTAPRLGTAVACPAAIRRTSRPGVPPSRTEARLLYPGVPCGPASVDEGPASSTVASPIARQAMTSLIASTSRSQDHGGEGQQRSSRAARWHGTAQATVRKEASTSAPQWPPSTISYARNAGCDSRRDRPRPPHCAAQRRPAPTRPRPRVVRAGGS